MSSNLNFLILFCKFSDPLLEWPFSLTSADSSRVHKLATDCDKSVCSRPEIDRRIVLPARNGRIEPFSEFNAENRPDVSSPLNYHERIFIEGLT